jgi:hypothetical protein
MKAIPADQIIEKLSEDFQDLVVREAFMRQRHAAYSAGLRAKRIEQATQGENKPGLLSFRDKDEFKAQQQKLRDEIAAYEQHLATCDLILAKCGKALETELEDYFRTQSPEFAKAGSAQKLVPEWEAAAGLYRSSLKQLVQALGIARNQMSSGYDPKNHKFAAGANEAFDAATSAAKAVETQQAVANQIAKRYRELVGLPPTPAPGAREAVPALPYLENVGLAKQVAALKAATLEVAQARVAALLTDTEREHQDGVPQLVAGLRDLRARQQAIQDRVIAAPLAEIRAMGDAQVDPAHSDTVFASLEARFVALTG